MLKVENLDFRYPGRTVFHNLSFETRPGNITALVGPNGSGKTTLLRCLTALATPQSGRVILDGIDVYEEPRRAHRLTGYLSDFFGLYDRLTVRQHLAYMADCQSLETSIIPGRIAETAEAAGLTEKLDIRAGTLSRGWRQRLGIALAIIHRPRFLMLDEPASGLDPEARHALSGLLLKLRDQFGMSIIVSSHILAELEDYCTDMLVLRNGRIAEHIHLDTTTRNDTAVQLELSTLSDPSALAGELAKDGRVSDIEIRNQTITCLFQGGAESQAALLKQLVSGASGLYSFSTNQRMLSARYMQIASEDNAHGF